jgi:hypothetical protein
MPPTDAADSVKGQSEEDLDGGGEFEAQDDQEAHRAVDVSEYRDRTDGELQRAQRECQLQCAGDFVALATKETRALQDDRVDADAEA